MDMPQQPIDNGMQQMDNQQIPPMDDIPQQSMDDEMMTMNDQQGQEIGNKSEFDTNFDAGVEADGKINTDSKGKYGDS